jgi:hypothetical protein
MLDCLRQNTAFFIEREYKEAGELVVAREFEDRSIPTKKNAQAFVRVCLGFVAGFRISF